MPETQEYGITSFVYRARAPFDPVRIHAVLNGDLPGVIRAKGHFWLATRPDWAAEFSLAGSMSTVKPLGTWWACVPPSRWPSHPEARAEMQAHWQEPWGDRRQEIVFIGQNLDDKALKGLLDSALIETTAYHPESWQGLADPFPRWARAA